MGRTPALMRVVLARKYSRNSGATSEESETTASGKTSFTIVARARLVRGVEVGVEVADTEGFHALRLQSRRRVTNRLLVERRQHGAGGVQPLRDAEAQVPGGERAGLLE